MRNLVAAPKPASLFRRLLNKLRNSTASNRQFPWPLRNEIAATKRVLKSSQWNMGYGTGLVHEQLEAEFAEYTQSQAAVAVNTGGMALQIAMRALGIVPGNEIIHQVDTCIANAFSVFAAGAIPIFADSDPHNYKVSIASLEQWIGPNTKLIIPTHLWGNPENIAAIRALTAKHNLSMLEDCCLALGATDGAQHVGHGGQAAVFSFGCVKPIQTGEGGMIVTNDKSLAREMRSLRGWGERLREYNDDDIRTLAWNGRMSEIVAAVALEQLRGYPRLLREVRDNCRHFIYYLRNHPWVTPIYQEGSCFSQLVLRFNSSEAGFLRDDLRNALLKEGVGAGLANFDPLVHYCFFQREAWKTWVLPSHHERAALNYSSRFLGAETIYERLGLGIARNSFLGKQAVSRLIERWERALKITSSKSRRPGLSLAS